ncbi:sulfotransferase family protein [Nitrosovibrio sp. Nv4]|uniref:sulfotransferase family protein n=1 Tax=Nitrosovibrio sp. Nv4 TaxID=1945880 RepID=UPI000BCE1EE9|nr:hypothetical protein [Nitrosovibrio sp. Nv4]SOD40040.1 hypothetical protein SAMN06298226_0281 [Nitrosovibrio sp. Nv4]
MSNNNALIILGMHRSGTSLLTGLLSHVGVKMGRRLYAPQKGVNEKGFWEHEDIVDTHDEILLGLGSQWDDLLPLGDKWREAKVIQPFIDRLDKLVERDFSDTSIWALKDPRMCRLLPLWLPLLNARQIKPTFICMNRNPFEVVASLQKRDGFSREKALILWLSHSLSAELYSRGLPRVFIDFDQIVKNPAEVLSRIEREAHLVFPIPVNEASENISEFVSPDLRHHKADVLEMPGSANEGLSLMAHKLYRIFKEMTVENEHQYEMIDSVAADFSAYREKWNVELLEQIRYLNQERADYRIKFFRIYTSWSWLLVKPVWLIEKWIRKY